MEAKRLLISMGLVAGLLPSACSEPLFEEDDEVLLEIPAPTLFHEGFVHGRVVGIDDGDVDVQVLEARVSPFADAPHKQVSIDDVEGAAKGDRLLLPAEALGDNSDEAREEIRARIDFGKRVSYGADNPDGRENPNPYAGGEENREYVEHLRAALADADWVSEDLPEVQADILLREGVIESDLDHTEWELAEERAGETPEIFEIIRKANAKSGFIEEVWEVVRTVEVDEPVTYQQADLEGKEEQWEPNVWELTNDGETRTIVLPDAPNQLFSFPGYLAIHIQRDPDSPRLKDIAEAWVDFYTADGEEMPDDRSRDELVDDVIDAYREEYD